MLYHQMLREKEVLDQREKNILERLQTYPAGKLIYSQNGKHKKWYISGYSARKTSNTKLFGFV